MEPVKYWYEEGRNKIIEEILTKELYGRKSIDLRDSYKASKIVLRNYITLDIKHSQEIIRKIKTIEKYHNDSTKIRPLNILLIAPPGSGKSHLVKSLTAVRQLRGLCNLVNFNMANFKTHDDFMHPIEAARNIKVQDKLPIIFLDELDSDYNNFSFVLPLLWDGEILIQGRNIKLGKSIFILAISNEDIIIKPNEYRDKIKKLDDFLSRINGGNIKIPPLDLETQYRNRKVDKICITLSLLERKYRKALKFVPRNLLYFIGKTKFKYGVRSIAHLIDMFSVLDKHGRINPSKTLSFLKDGKSLKQSGFYYHLEEDEIDEVISIWNRIKGDKAEVQFLEELPNRLYSDWMENFLKDI